MWVGCAQQAQEEALLSHSQTAHQPELAGFCSMKNRNHDHHCCLVCAPKLQLLCLLLSPRLLVNTFFYRRKARGVNATMRFFKLFETAHKHTILVNCFRQGVLGNLTVPHFWRLHRHTRSLSMVCTKVFVGISIEI